MTSSEYEGSEQYEDESESSSEAGSSKSDIDRPRVAQWVDDEDVEDVPPDEESQPRPGPSNKPEDNIKNIRNDLSSVSYAALLKARRTLTQAEAQSDESESSGSDTEESVDDAGKPESSSKAGQRDAPRKRSNKHAPVETSAKFPVSRKKVVVDVKKKAYRDPRFSALSGELSTQKFQSQYSFLADLHKTELSTLKENLARAKKLLRSSPRDLREAREEEVQRLEASVKRAESTVNRDKSEQVSSSMMDKLKKEEKEKRKQGKSGWWLKDSAKKELLLKARHESLIESGGKVAVKKAIEKRQRKINQKEKRSRPSFAPRSSNAEGAGSSRRNSESHRTKRQRVS